MKLVTKLTIASTLAAFMFAGGIGLTGRVFRPGGDCRRCGGRSRAHHQPVSPQRKSKVKNPLVANGQAKVRDFRVHLVGDGCQGSVGRGPGIAGESTIEVPHQDVEGVSRKPTGIQALVADGKRLGKNACSEASVTTCE